MDKTKSPFLGGLTQPHNPFTPSKKKKKLSIRRRRRADMLSCSANPLTGLLGQVIELVPPALAYFAFLAHGGMG